MKLINNLKKASPLGLAGVPVMCVGLYMMLKGTYMDGARDAADLIGEELNLSITIDKENNG